MIVLGSLLKRCRKTVVQQQETAAETVSGQHELDAPDTVRQVASQVAKVELPGLPGHIEAQKNLCDEVRRKVEQSPYFGREDCDDLIKAMRTLRRVKKNMTVEQLRTAEKRLARELKSEESNWKVFLSAAAVLQEYGFMTEDYKVTALGSLGASLRATNELWVSIVLLADPIAKLQPQQLAGVLSALLAEGARLSQVINFRAAPATLAMIPELRLMCDRLGNAQRKRGLDFAVILDESDAGLVEAWANGTEWSEVMAGTNLQEGDVCRRLRRVMDMLRQIPRLPMLSEAVKLNAKRAVTLMDRFPVADNVTYVVNSRDRVDLKEAGDFVSDNVEDHVEQAEDAAGEALAGMLNDLDVRVADDEFEDDDFELLDDTDEEEDKSDVESVGLDTELALLLDDTDEDEDGSDVEGIGMDNELQLLLDYTDEEEDGPEVRTAEVEGEIPVESEGTNSNGKDPKDSEVVRWLNRSLQEEVGGAQ